MVSPSEPMTAAALVDAIDRLLPQTQCRRCGYDDCRAYADAIARGEAAINRCPPGADTTIQALAGLLGRPVIPLAADLEPMPVRHVVRIDPQHCIGCTKCILACPVDAIVGAPRFQHQVLTDRCTGCELCLPPCPTDCISLVPMASPWQATDAGHGRRHHQRRDQRLQVMDSARRTGSAAHPPPPSPPRGNDPAVPAGARATGAAATASNYAPDAPRHEGGTSTAPGTPPPHAAMPQAQQGIRPATSPLPASTGHAVRDPNIALADADEKARRLAAIRARVRPPRPRPAAR